MSTDTTDTLGHQKKTNYALQTDLTKEEFIKEILTGLTPPPAYFPKNVMMNIKGYESIDEVIDRGKRALSAFEFEMIANTTNAIMLDTRDADAFSKGFIPNSINIGIDGNFAVWVGTLIPDINQQLLLITEPGREEEVITRLARVGYDHAIGFLRGGFAAWKRSGVVTDSIASISAQEFSSLASIISDLLIIDVRKASEFDSQHLENAINIPLDYINESMPLLDKQKTYYVHCAGGYRSMVFISILKARGYNNLINVEGGFAAIRKTHKLNLTDYVSPTTKL